MPFLVTLLKANYFVGETLREFTHKPFVSKHLMLQETRGFWRPDNRRTILYRGRLLSECKKFLEKIHNFILRDQTTSSSGPSSRD